MTIDARHSQLRIVITGANRGLGYALASVACARGHIVIAGVRSPEARSESLLQLAERYPSQVIAIRLDVADEQSVSEAAAIIRADHRLGAVDAIINSAGILLGREQKLEELDFAQMEQSIRTNLYGPMIVMKYMLPLLYEGEQQCVINVSSEAGSFKSAYGGDYSYAISKSALNMFTAQLKVMLTRQNIAVYAVHPGWIKTDMGGDQAPGDALESAEGILDLVEKKQLPAKDAWFVDHLGNGMPL